MQITRASLLIGLLMLAACGGDDDGPPPYQGGGFGGGGGTGGTGAIDASSNDSGRLDGGDEDADTPTPRCIPEADDRFDVVTQGVDPSTFSLIGAPASFGLAYEVTACGNGLDVLRFASGAGDFTPQTVVNGSGDCSRAYDPALWFGEGMWRLFYWDNRGGENQLWSRVLDSDDEPTVEVASAQSGRNPIVARINGRTQLAWVEQSTPPSQWTALYMRPWNDRDAEPTPLIAPSAQQHGFGFVIASVETVGAVAWVDTQSADKGAFIQPLTDTAEVGGVPIKLSPQVSNRSSVDIADNLEGAAVIYSTVTDNVAFEVRFRPLDETGRPTGTEERIVPRSERGTDASIAPVGASYVVAYRALPAVADGTAELRMFFVDKVGRRQSEAIKLADTTADGGRVTVRASFDGRFTIAWVEATAESQRLRMIRVPCR